MPNPDLDHLQPPLRAAIVAAEDDLRRQNILLGSHITSGYRNYEQQAALYANRANNPNPVAAPGTSPHGRGEAIDISLVGWGEEQQQAVIETLHRYGLSRPVANDPVHWQLLHPGQVSPPEQPSPATVPPVFPVFSPPQSQSPDQSQYPTDGTMLPMASTMLSAAGYRAETSELLCEFVKTGRPYTYFGVPESVWQGLVDAGSKGSYMRQAVIGVFPF